MFLDPDGPVTIQRFEEVKYQKLANFESTFLAVVVTTGRSDD